MTIKEFAALAGVSPSTVSKIMNGKDKGIRAETREHVLRLAKEYHYKALPYSGSPEARTFVLGLIAGGKDHHDCTIDGFVNRASKLGYMVLCTDSQCDPETEKKNIIRMLEMKVDALIWDPLPSSDVGALTSMIEKHKVPYLFLSSEDNRKASLPHIDLDQIAYAATDELLRRGHTRIACLLDEDRFSAAIMRGYRQCLYDHEIIAYNEMIFYDETAMLDHLGENPFTALVVAREATAQRVCHDMKELHYNIPKDLSVVTVSSACRETNERPVVSSLGIPYFAYGEHLANCLVHRIEKRPYIQEFSCTPEQSSDVTLGPPIYAKRKRILSVGSVNIDNYLNFNELPHSGTMTASSSLSVYPGGKCLNQAIGASLLGHPVSVIGRVGDDADSARIYNTAKEYAIDHQGLMRTEREKTGQAYIFVGGNGESMISLLPGANRVLTPGDMTRNRRLFSPGGFCLLQTEIPMPALIEAAKLAKENEMRTVLKPSACDTLPDELLDHMDMLVPNQSELELLCTEGRNIEEKAEHYLRKGVATVIVTRGASGCYVRTQEVSTYIPAIELTAVDVTGAGDAFICCLVSYLIYGYDVVRAARIATYAAGISTTRQGTVPALVDRATLEAYITNVEAGLIE